MYIAICDDQESILQELSQLLVQWQKRHGIHLHFKTYQNPSQLLDAAPDEQFSVYLLDVVMPKTDGLSAARTIRGFDSNADIVFLTVSPEFAFESYSVHASDYLLKPIDPQAFFAMLDRILLRQKVQQESLHIKCGRNTMRIPLHMLTYVEVNGKHLFFNLSDGTVRETYGTLKEYEPILLDHKQFMQVHRSYIVNMLQVEEFTANYIRTTDGKQVPVSRLLYAKLQKDYLALLFDREED